MLVREYESLRPVFKFLLDVREEVGMSWDTIEDETDLKPADVRRWADGKLPAVNAFFAQIVADALGYDLALRLSRDGVVLAETTVDRELARAFKALRILSDVQVKRAAVVSKVPAPTIERYEDGLPHPNSGQPILLPFDRHQALARALGGRLTVVLRKRVGGRTLRAA